MKVVLFNGSMNPNGNTNSMLRVMEKVFNDEGIETEVLCIGGKPVRDCIACGGCFGKGKCVFDDDVANLWLEKAKEADGIVFGSPVYFAHASGRLLSIMDRMFYASGGALAQKVGACVAVARRAGTIQAIEDMNKHLTISGLIVPSSTYWNLGYGRNAGEFEKDAEGIQTMQNLAKNMAWVMKCLNLGKSSGLPAPELNNSIRTNFIR